MLKNYSTGVFTTVTATLAASNVSSSLSLLPNAGTDAYNMFSFFPNFGPSASYNSSSFPWYYMVTFTGLDPTKTYEFATTANRGSSSYAGDGPSSRWTKFSIIGADLYTNTSSTGVVQMAPNVVRMNTGYNTVNGYVVRWSGISASDGEFRIVSENVSGTIPTESVTWGRIKALYDE